MQIVVDGWRAGISEWREARRVPADKLPQLTAEQKEVARKMGIPEEDYARSVLAGRRTQDQLLEKTRTFAALLERKINMRDPQARVNIVRLNTLEHRFEIEAIVQGRRVFFRVDENLVDDLLSRGSEGLERNLDRVLEYALAGRVA